ncbi:hypothetical protein I3843_13G062600 [Carya illinoinensis]|nr:hypothetical protein I3843_13G062600 [Carya illinoinensis]
MTRSLEAILSVLLLVRISPSVFSSCFFGRTHEQLYFSRFFKQKVSNLVVHFYSLESGMYYGDEPTDL